jgi:hypothetical protein
MSELVSRIQYDAHHVQVNLATATTTTHPMSNRKIETAKSACFLNFLRPSLIGVVRRKKIERTKRKIGIAATTKAIILKIIVRCQFCCLARRRMSDVGSTPENIRDDAARGSDMMSPRARSLAGG